MYSRGIIRFVRDEYAVKRDTSTGIRVCLAIKRSRDSLLIRCPEFSGEKED